MMITIRNISLTQRAAPDFHRERLAFRAEPGEVFALVWVSNYAHADGSPVTTFKPGYMCGPLYAEGLAAPWAIAQLADGVRFHFMPRFEWRSTERYLIDKSSALFSIWPVTG